MQNIFTTKKTLFFLILLHFTCFSFAQTAEKAITPVKPSFFAGTITATNNGISLLPNFSLNRPAVLFDLSMGKGRLSFDPMMRFAMDGKPWAFILWWRYKVFTGDKFKMSIGAHPSFVFSEKLLTNAAGKTINYWVAQRYFAEEITPTYFFTKKIGLGLTYLHSNGLDDYAVQNTNFVALRGVMNNLKLFKDIQLTFLPQFYYLQMDATNGTYVSATAILGKKGFPLTISSIVSQAIETTVKGNKMVWNIGLNYNFNRPLVPKPN